jgi:heat shock protein HslJ
MPNNKNMKTWWMIGGAAVLIIILALIINGQSASSGATPLPEATNPTPTASNPATPSNSTGGTVKVTAPVNTVTISKYALDGKRFRIGQYDNNVVPTGENYLVSFDNGELSAKICNTITGPYTETTGTLTARLMKTQVGCSDPADINAVEQIFGNVFTQVVAYTLSAGTLSLSGDGHSMILTTY